MYRNKTVFVWILSFEGFNIAHCKEQCLDADGTIFECEYGCCCERLDRYCCTHHLWIIILFTIAGAAVIIPAAIISFCLIRDKVCPGKPLVRDNPLRGRQIENLGSHSSSDSVGQPTTYGETTNPAYTDPHSSTALPY